MLSRDALYLGGFIWALFMFFLETFPLSTFPSVCTKLLQSCLTLCDPMDHSPPGSSVHGILKAGILEWVAIPPPGDLPVPGFEPRSLMSPALAGLK